MKTATAEMSLDEFMDDSHDPGDKSASDLMRNYNEAEAFLGALASEQRSNLLLVAGNHYTGRGSKFHEKVRQADNISKSQKLRLTKNHIQKITKSYVNNILRYAPTVGIEPKNKDELQDVAAAELHSSVWTDIKKRHKFHKLTRLWAKDYVEIGEAIAKIFFDDNAGHFLGYEQHVDEDGNALMDDNKPVWHKAFTGDLVFERILGFNLLTDPDARSWEECRWVIYRKMVDIEELRVQFKGDSVKMAAIHESFRQTYKIFDAGSGTYRTGEGLTMLMEHYYRPCALWPNGYYYITTESTILYEGELPEGLFPILYCGFDEASTSARSFSIIKQLRPFQAEINRCASKIAEHQITLGDDKMLLLNGSSMSAGGTAHGVKAIHVTGSEPKVFAGRTGEQYLGYMESQIKEMYQISSVQEDSAEKQKGQMDPFAALYESAREKKPYVIYIEKFEEFLCDIAELALRLAKAFYHDEMLVRIVGRNDYVNIEEFRSAEDLGYQINAVPTTEDLESKMGQQLTLNHFIQYAGPSMTQKDLGLVMQSMPWLNDKQIFEDTTMDYENAKADILSLDRGEFVPADPSDDQDYMLKKISNRMKRRDFKTLSPQIQQMYAVRKQQHVQIKAQQILAEQKAEAGFIPSGGFLTTVDMYVPDPMNAGQHRRVRVPSESVQWLVQQLEQQGTTQQQIQMQDMQTQAQLGSALGPRPMPGIPQGNQGVPMGRPALQNAAGF